jgi:hypothetical protein
MDGNDDAASVGVVHAVPRGVTRVANHDAAKRFFAEFPGNWAWHSCVVLARKEPHPHVMGMVVDDEHAVAEAM